MKFELKLEEKLKREWLISIGPEEINDKKTIVISKIAKTYKKNGFRDGYVPLNIVEDDNKQRIMAELVDELINESISRLMRENEVKPAAKPEIKLEEFDENNGMKISYKVEIIPENVPIPNFSQYAVEDCTVEVSEEDIEEALKNIFDQNRRFEEAEKVAENGDKVVIDFVGKVDGKEFEGGKAEDFSIVLGSGSTIKGFEEQLIGSKKGSEVKIQTTFPEDYFNQELAGKAVEFDAKVKEVHVSTHKEPNESFAKALGFDNLEKLKEDIKQNLAKYYKKLAFTRFKKKLFDEIEDDCKFDIPETLKQNEFDNLMKAVEHDRQRNPKAYADKTEAQLKEEFTKMAVRRIKLGLLLAEIARKNNMQVSEDEIRDAVIEQASANPEYGLMLLENMKKNPEAREQVAGPILEDKVVNYIKQQVKLSEKSVNSKQLIELIQSEV